MERYEAYMTRLMDVTRECNFAFWGAMLTFHGIVVSVFSAVALFGDKAKPITFFLVLLSMLSSFLIILNFRTMRNVYRKLGQVGQEAIVANRSEEQELQDIQAAEASYETCNRRELVCLLALTLQAISVLYLLLLKQ